VSIRRSSSPIPSPAIRSRRCKSCSRHSPGDRVADALAPFLDRRFCPRIGYLTWWSSPHVARLPQHCSPTLSGAAILARLTSSEASVTELADPFEMSLPGVSKHRAISSLSRAATGELSAPGITTHGGGFIPRADRSAISGSVAGPSSAFRPLSRNKTGPQGVSFY
jgi:hypothetical protein